jgi:hypothetical protein
MAQNLAPVVVLAGIAKSWPDLGMDKKGDIQEVRWWISTQLSIYWMDTQIFGWMDSLS